MAKNIDFKHATVETQYTWLHPSQSKAKYKLGKPSTFQGGRGGGGGWG